MPFWIISNFWTLHSINSDNFYDTRKKITDVFKVIYAVVINFSLIYNENYNNRIETSE